LENIKINLIANSHSASTSEFVLLAAVTAKPDTLTNIFDVRIFD